MVSDTLICPACGTAFRGRTLIELLTGKRTARTACRACGAGGLRLATPEEIIAYEKRVSRDQSLTVIWEVAMFVVMLVVLALWERI
jgi:hypothetical protein